MHVAYCKTCLPTKTVVAWGTVPTALAAHLHSDHDPAPNNTTPGFDDSHAPTSTAANVTSSTFELTDAEWDTVKDSADVPRAIADSFGDKFV